MNRVRHHRVAHGLFISLLALGLGLAPLAARGQKERCKERCEKQRQEKQKSLEQCLARVEPWPRDRAAKMKLLCHEKYQPPKCDNLPPCKKSTAKEKSPQPGLTLGHIVFSMTKRGPPLARASFAAGSELFLRIDVTLVPKPGAKQIWLQENLRILVARGQGKLHELARWDDYFQERTFIDPEERGLAKLFTIHGGAQLPADWKPGEYQIEAEIKEKVSGFEKRQQATFFVTAPRQKKK